MRCADVIDKTFFFFARDFAPVLPFNDEKIWRETELTVETERTVIVPSKKSDLEPTAENRSRRHGISSRVLSHTALAVEEIG